MKTPVTVLARLLPPDLRERFTGLASAPMIAVRDAYDERMAICTIDGGQTEEQAQRIALAEVADLLVR